MPKPYEALLELARDIILFIAPDGRIADANAAALTAYGYTREELVGRAITDLRSPDTIAQVGPQFAEALKRGILFETVHRRKDGSTFPVEVSSRLAARGDETMVLSIIRDISDRRRIERELQQAKHALEERVEERTRELAAANAELTARIDELSWAQRVIVEQAREIGELSTPVIELWDALLVVPMAGEFNEPDVAALTERILRRVAESRATVVLLDVTGMAGIEATTARSLLDTARAVRLLGAAVILTGVRPTIARTLTSLGVDLGSLEIRATLADGLKAAFARRGLAVVARR